MRTRFQAALPCFAIAASLALALSVQGQQPPAKKAAQPRNTNKEAPIQIPEGFTPIFNGKDLSGWHISKTNHHGTTPDFHIVEGIIVGRQNPPTKGGILLTDKKYKNVEVYMEVKPDWGCDGGLFLRSDEAGEAYQVTLDYLPGGPPETTGSMGGVYGEELKGVRFAGPSEETWKKAWKRDEWNRVRVRMEGDVPHFTTWINDQQVFDYTDTANHAIGGATDGFLAIEVHGGDRWRPAAFWRWRAIAVKELP